MSENERKSMIKVRGGFSERIGKPTCITTVQLNEFDDHTRTQISNQLFKLLDYIFSNQDEYSVGMYQGPASNMGSDFCKALRADVLGYSVFLHPSDIIRWDREFDRIDNVIAQAPYKEVLDVIEYCYYWVTHRSVPLIKTTWKNAFTLLFRQEYVGYRFVSDQIVPITDELEIREIEQACKTPFDGARTQLQKALGFLSDREHPDYKNCVKESISAVESVCKVISGSEKAALKDALNGLIANGMNIHGSLKSAILALYGYASDEGGIRHAERETESTVTFEEAKFMMVTCSAIVNYLVAEYGKHGAENA